MFNKFLGVKELNKILQNCVIFRPTNRVYARKKSWSWITLLFLYGGSNMVLCEKCRISGLNVRKPFVNKILLEVWNGMQ